MLRTAFAPDRHGYHFSNNDIAWTWGPFSGSYLCGGMVYSALDFFLSGYAVPAGTAAPPVGSPLNQLITDRQMAAHASTAARFGLASTPLLGPLAGSFESSLSEEFDRMVRWLAKGTPVPLCLYQGHGFGHHTLAIGCGSRRDESIFLYDPNHPDRVSTLTRVPDSPYFRHLPTNRFWGAFFVDDGYRKEQPPLMNGQPGWRWCRRCQGLFFGGSPTKGKCPAGGPHDGSTSGGYTLALDGGSGQADWRWCGKCQGLYFAGNAGSAGVCPDGGIHNGSASGVYTLAVSAGAGQQNWRWCQACDGLFFAGNATLGACPTNPRGHDGSRSGNYFVPHAA